MKVKKSCLNCQSSFESYQSQNKKFCGQKCRYEYHSKSKSSIVRCEYCSKEFKAINSNLQKGWDRYCSKKCKGMALSGKNAPNWAGIETKCLECGGVFLTVPSRLDERRGIFCSKKCRDAYRAKIHRGQNNPSWKGGKIKELCLECGAEFEIFPSRKNRIRFCSKQCQYNWRSKNQRGPNNPAWRGGLTEVSCQQCKSTFQVKRSWAEKGRTFCSKKCFSKWMSEAGTFSGKNNPLWNGGSSFEPYPLTFSETFKKQIRSRDGYQCTICLWYGNMVHHVDYDKENTSPANCLTLCNSCHSKTNANRNYWQQLLTPIVQERCQ